MKSMSTGRSVMSLLWKFGVLGLAAAAMLVSTVRADQPTLTAETSAPTQKSEDAPITDDTTIVYVVPIRGQFGRDISPTPMKKVMADAKARQPDIILLSVDCAFAPGGEQIEEWKTFAGQQSWMGLGQGAASEIALLLRDNIRDDSQWKTRSGGKPRIVAWVKGGLGPACFFIMSIPEIYMHPQGKIGGVGYLNVVFTGVGDYVAQEKQRSLRLGRFEGLVQMGGYPVKLARAMARADTLMSADIVGGKPVFRDDVHGEIVLADGGDESRRDTIEKLLAFEGTNVLTLKPEIAKKLGVSKGTIENEDELVSTLGIERNYVLMSKEAAKILRNWSKSVSDAERKIGSLLEEYRRIQVQGANASERNALRGRQLKHLNDIKAQLNMYGEAIDPSQYGPADQIITQINIIIERIRTEIRLDR